MDILKFLIIVAIIAIPIIREARKNKAKSSDNPPPAPAPRGMNPMKNIPLPEEKRTTASPKETKKNKKYSETIQAKPIAKKTASPPRVSRSENESEIAIRSAEDARRAIVWSEILNRKY